MDSFKNHLNEKRFGGDTNIPASKDITKYIESGKGIIVDVPSTLHPTSRFAIYKNPATGSGQDKVLMATISNPKRGKVKMFSFHGTHVSHQKAMDFAKKHKLVAMKDAEGNPLFAKESVELDEVKSPVKSLGKEAKAVLAMALNMSLEDSGAVAHDNNLEYFTPDAIDTALKFLAKNASKLNGDGKKAAKEIMKKLGESVELDNPEYESELGEMNIGESFEFQFADKETAQKFMREISQKKLGASTGTSDGKVRTEGPAQAGIGSPTRAHQDMAKIMKKHGGKILRTDEGPRMKRVFKEDYVEPIEEMSAKKHYEKMIQQDKLGGKRVAPIDRKRFPNREREGLEGPYRSKKSGQIYYYDKKAGKYYDTQSDMYLDVKDVMDSVDMSAVRNFLNNRK